MGMEERLRELNGHLRVISTLGDGTRLEFRLPVPNHGKEMLREQSLAQIEMPAELKPAEQARR